MHFLCVKFLVQRYGRVKFLTNFKSALSYNFYQHLICNNLHVIWNRMGPKSPVLNIGKRPNIDKDSSCDANAADVKHSNLYVFPRKHRK